MKAYHKAGVQPPDWTTEWFAHLQTILETVAPGKLAARLGVGASDRGQTLPAKEGAEQLEAYRRFSEWFAEYGPRRSPLNDEIARAFPHLQQTEEDVEVESALRELSDHDLITAALHPAGDAGVAAAFLEDLERRRPKYSNADLERFKKQREAEAVKRARRESNRMKFRT